MTLELATIEVAAQTDGCVRTRAFFICPDDGDVPKAENRVSMRDPIELCSIELPFSAADVGKRYTLHIVPEGGVAGEVH